MSSFLRRRLQFAVLPAAALSVALSVSFAEACTPAAPQQELAAQSAQPSPNASRAGSTPMVVYQNGQLTITAENVPLSEIMSALHSAMGTEVDLPSGSSAERIWARIGPGPARKVLGELLANTDLNYVIQGSSEEPGGVQSVTLTLRTPDGAPVRTGPAVESAMDRRRSRSNPAPAPEPEQGTVTEPQETATAPAATPTEATPAAATPTAQPAESAATLAETASSSIPSVPNATGTPNIAPETPQPSAGSFNPHPTPPPSLSTDQMVQQLANMYQQRRQMQQSQTGSAPN